MHLDCWTYWISEWYGLLPSKFSSYQEGMTCMYVWCFVLVYLIPVMEYYVSTVNGRV